MRDRRAKREAEEAEAAARGAGGTPLVRRQSASQLSSEGQPADGGSHHADSALADPALSYERAVREVTLFP